MEASAYVLVWVEGCERPVYACPVALPPAHHTLPTSSAVSAVNVITLWRLVASLALLSPPTTSTPASSQARTSTHDTRQCPTTQLVKLASGLHCAVARVTPSPSSELQARGCTTDTYAYAVAVLAAPTEPDAALTPRRDENDGVEGLLGWVAESVLASLHPGHTWTASLAAPAQSHTEEGGEMHLQVVTAPLRACAAAQTAAALEAATAMEDYGLREVLADGGAAASAATLAAALTDGENNFEALRRDGWGAQAWGGVSPVVATVQAALHRWWIPFTKHLDEGHSGGGGGDGCGRDANRDGADRTRVALAGLFALPSTTTTTSAGECVDGSAVVHACLSPCRPALRLLADCCRRHTTLLQLAEPPTDTTPLAVLPLNTGTALMATCVGCVPHHGRVLYEAVLVHRDAAPAATHHTEFYVAHASLRAVHAHGTLWHPAVLRDVWG